MVLAIVMLVPFMVIANTLTQTMQVGDSRTMTPSSGSTMYVKITTENLEGLQVRGDYNCSTSSSVKITAKKRGTWQFGVSHSSGSMTTHIWNVVDVVSIDIPKNITLKCGETYTYNPIITDSKAETTLTWHSSNTSVATINNGVLSTHGVGTTIITVKASNGVEATSQVEVTDVKVSEIQISSEPLNINVGDSYQLKYTVLPSNATNKTVTFQSSNPQVIDVSPYGEVTALSSGYSYITISATDNSNVKNYIKVNAVGEDYPNSSDISVNIIDLGVFTLNVPNGTILTFDYTPLSNIWSVKNASFNGQQLTPQDENNLAFKTPEIENTSTIIIDLDLIEPIMGELTAGLGLITLDGLALKLNEGILNIEGLKETNTIDIYQMNGCLVYKDTMAQDGTYSLQLPSGIFIVVINGNKSFKINNN